MTDKHFASGTDRIASVAEKLPSAEIVVNIQGDEPFINPVMIDEAIEPLLFDKNVEISTLVKKITSVEELQSKSVPKVVFDYENYALYFSRSPIPFVREGKNNLERIALVNIYKHIGLYVFRKKSLIKFTQLEQTELELAEKLEQLRMLEFGMKIKVVPTEYDSFSVDTPKDLELARKYYQKIQQKIK
jgi:3-deoxy-manno-octulosonate cytidylyltransferase (CMP-KDO synthetase)